MKKTHLAAAAAAVVLAVWVVVPAPSRADAPSGRYAFPTSGTVLDTKTGLVWQRKSGTPASQATAASTCFNNPMALTGTGWRVPTVKELLTLLDLSRSNGLDSAAFPSEPAGPYWSATTTSVAGDFAWIVNFPPSNVTHETAQTTEAHLIRCVR